ncbi:MAG: basic amino acid/polyamine antiporter, family [Phycisphaerales bacterium]|jgi:amino acid transporter|nr:basic amino acid/polyamine antiporter, family [Phycisphaerales bacterium]
MDTAATASAAPGQPRRCLSVASAVGIVVGIVVGAGIFQFPSLVAMNVSSATMMIALWVAGGIISLIGALCYAELASTYPDAGGDYHFIGRAYGPQVAFLFAWARMTVIQTGSIAVIAFVIGEYAAAALPLGAYGPAIYAALSVVLLTGLNLAGVRLGAGAQLVATVAVVLGLLMVVFAGFTSTPPAVTGNSGGSGGSAIGLAMVFVLLTYGGWNEAAYLSAEVRSRAGIVWALLLGIAIVTAVYLLMNLAMLHALGLGGMASSMTIAADVMRTRFGEVGAKIVSVVVVLAAATTANATIITGARSNYALGRDFPLLGRLSRWREHGNTPTTALIVQAVITLVLVAVGWLSQNPDDPTKTARKSLESMVAYITPVFWVFFLLTGISLFVLRYRDREIERPFKVPLYPVTPLLFCGACAYMLWSSLNYAGRYSWIGLAVLIAGVPLLLAARPRATMPRFPVQTAVDVAAQQQT